MVPWSKLPIKSTVSHNSLLGSAALQRTEAGLHLGQVDSVSETGMEVKALMCEQRVGKRGEGVTPRVTSDGNGGSRTHPGREPVLAVGSLAPNQVASEKSAEKRVIVFQISTLSSFSSPHDCISWRGDGQAS